MGFIAETETADGTCFELEAWGGSSNSG